MQTFVLPLVTQLSLPSYSEAKLVGIFPRRTTTLQSWTQIRLACLCWVSSQHHTRFTSLCQLFALFITLLLMADASRTASVVSDKPSVGSAFSVYASVADYVAVALTDLSVLSSLLCDAVSPCEDRGATLVLKNACHSPRRAIVCGML